jgi:hypothetical protein
MCSPVLLARRIPLSHFLFQELERYFAVKFSQSIFNNGNFPKDSVLQAERHLAVYAKNLVVIVRVSDFKDNFAFVTSSAKFFHDT